MDTKSKRSRYDLRFKILAWLVCIATGCLISFSIVRLAKYDPANTITSDKYVESAEYLQSMVDYTNSVGYAFYGYGDEGKQLALRDYISSLRDSYSNEIGAVLGGADLGEGDYDEYVEKFKAEFSALVAQSGEAQAAAQSTEVAGADSGEPDPVAEAADSGADSSADRYSYLPALDEYTQKQIDSVNRKYADLLMNAESHIDKKYASMKAQAQENLKRNSNYYYAVTENGKVVYTNAPEGEKDPVLWVQSFEANKEYPWNDTTTGLYGEVRVQAGRTSVPYSSPTYGAQDGVSIYTGMSDSYYERQKEEYSGDYKGYLTVITLLIVWIALFAAGFVWLMYTAGRSPYGDEVKVTFMDSVYLDIGGVVLLLIELALFSLFSQEQIWMPGAVGAVQVIRISVYAGIGVALALMWSMSVSRRVKRHENHTLVGRIFGGIIRTYSKGSLRAKGVGAVIWFLIGGLLLAFMTVLLGFMIGGAGVFIGVVFIAIYLTAALKYILSKADAVQSIAEGVRHIKEGDLDYTIKKGGGPEYDEIATGIEHIAEGLEAAVSREVKSERMKTELITNVSHDIKTPLTSILTYVDLLKKEGVASPNAPKYLEVLDMKSRRLKYLTDDLFEAAKASSGDMKVELSRIELVQFMEQAMGEMSDKIDASGLEFVLASPDGKMFVYADGKMLWRVIGNVIENALKYAADRSRVYIDFMRGEGQACIVVKNVSRDALNVSEEELMERFARGDESRHTEGSGLGLSIARNFMELMGGTFGIEIDGDLFKARICFPEQPEEPPQKNETD